MSDTPRERQEKLIKELRNKNVKINNNIMDIVGFNHNDFKCKHYWDKKGFHLYSCINQCELIKQCPIHAKINENYKQMLENDKAISKYEEDLNINNW